MANTINADTNLLDSFKNGDMQSFEQLVIKYKDKIAKTVYSIINNVSDVDDVVQDIFLIVYKSVRSFKGNSSFSTWLYRITVNRCYQELRKRKTRNQINETDFNGETAAEIGSILPSQEENMEDKMIRNELRENIQKTLNTLPEKYRVIFILKNINGLSYKEISETMNISMDKVKIWLFRARQKLEEQLKLQHQEAA